MSKRDHLAPPPPPRRERSKWTRPEDYLPNRRRRRAQPRPDPALQPEGASGSRLLLGMVPFLLLMFALGLLAVAIMITAYPGRNRASPPPPAAQEQGTAAPGWLKG